MEQMLTIKDICDKFKVTQRTVYRWMESGGLVGIKAGRVWRFQPEDVQRFIDGLPRSGPKPKDADK